MHTELDLFKALETDEEFTKKRDNNPILNAVFHSLYDFSKTGHKLYDLPWFSLIKKSDILRYE